MEIKKLTQHERVVLFRALRLFGAKNLKESIKKYVEEFGSKNIPHLLQIKE